MLDIPSITGIVAAVGVTIGVVFTVVELRNLTKTRQTDLVIRLYSTYGSKEYQEALDELRTREFKDYNDYMKKYSWSEVARVSILYEGLGVLLRKKLIDISLVDDLFSTPIKRSWERIKPVIEGVRKQLNRPEIFEWFEYLYNEMQEREQRLQQTQQ